MKLKLYSAVNPPKFEDNAGNNYYNNCLTFYTERHTKGTILFWLGSTEQNYFLCPIEDGEYIYGTPFIFIHRTESNMTYCVHDEIHYPNHKEEALKYPYYVQTLGCDDGHKVWRFKTEEEFMSWYKDIVTYLLSVDNVDLPEDDTWEFWDLFQEGQSFVN